MRSLACLGVEASAESAWKLAVEVVREGLRDDAIPSLARLGELGQVGDLPALIGELARQLAEPDRLELGAAPLPRGPALPRCGGAPAASPGAIARLVTECVVAYSPRAPADLAPRARRAPPTELLTPQTSTDELELEFERARRYDHG